jgi:DNA-binding NarL/FixJ family response regulator
MKLRSEVQIEPELHLLGEARTPQDAIAWTRQYEPQIVLCDHEMLADGQMVVLVQQAVVISLLVLVTDGDKSWEPKVSVPVAGCVSVHHRPGDLLRMLKAIVRTPAASVEGTLAQGKYGPPSGDEQLPEPICYDPSQLPTLAAVGSGHWSNEQLSANASVAQAKNEAAAEKESFLKTVF